MYPHITWTIVADVRIIRAEDGAPFDDAHCDPDMVDVVGGRGCVRGHGFMFWDDTSSVWVCETCDGVVCDVMCDGLAFKIQ